MKLGKFSLGCGDRFARQASAQLAAYQKIAAQGINVVPVWNKSNREHQIVGSSPDSVKAAAQAAVQQAGWKGEWHVDADHINLNTVAGFIDSADFFTIDVAESIGASVDEYDVESFLAKYDELVGQSR